MHILVSGLSRFTAPTGICRHVAGLAKALVTQPEVERITCLVGSWQQEYYESVLGLAAGAKIRIVPVDISNRSFRRNLWFATELPAMVRKFDPDLVHLSFPAPVRRLPCKTVVTVHDLYPYDFPSNVGYPKVLFIRAFLKTSIANSDAVACVSQATARRLMDVLPSSRTRPIAVIPNVMDFAQLLPRRPAWMVEASPFVLSVAQHRKNKNLSMAIRGLREMRDRKILPANTMLVIVGSDGPETPVLRQTIEDSGLNGSVKLVSSIEDCELRWLYEHCTLFLATSTVEGFCVPLLEAMYFGCGIVCSDIPIFREIGSESCHYVDLHGGSLKSLAHAAQAALQQGPVGHDVVPSRYSAHSVGQQYVALYSELLRTQVPAALEA